MADLTMLGRLVGKTLPLGPVTDAEFACCLRGDTEISYTALYELHARMREVSGMVIDEMQKRYVDAASHREGGKE